MKEDTKMGANLHTHIEYKTNDGVWGHYAAPQADRDYTLIALATGVRGDSNGLKPIVPPRGLPADMTAITRACLEICRKGHHVCGETYLTADEFKTLQQRFIEANPKLSEYECDFEEEIFKTYGPDGNLVADHAGFADMRVVFWVDD